MIEKCIGGDVNLKSKPYVASRVILEVSTLRVILEKLNRPYKMMPTVRIAKLSSITVKKWVLTD